MLLPRFEQIVKEWVIDRLDHKDLNEDTAEFRRVNPSVENIAWVIWGMLAEYAGP
ncbi:MAG TPA: 6-carboxytetrahydropterin synthase [Phycisphaerae bacterium]|nr:6-carboxytetrahydropterin synthase [Phycisphaerae bacterium]